MPRFTPDAERFGPGRPYTLWWPPLIDLPYTLARSASGEWKMLFAPTQEERQQYQFLFDSGRATYVTYQQVRDLDLVNLGRVRYVDDYDDQWTDVFIARSNEPFTRATQPEPVWDEE